MECGSYINYYCIYYEVSDRGLVMELLGVNYSGTPEERSTGSPKGQVLKGQFVQRAKPCSPGVHRT